MLLKHLVGFSGSDPFAISCEIIQGYHGENLHMG